MTQNQSFQAWQAQQPAPAGFVPAGAPAGVPAGPPVGPPAGPPQGWGQQHAPVQAPAHVSPVAPQPTGGSVFGAGAFAGAAPVSEKKDCQDGDYVFQIIKTEQFKFRDGTPAFRILTRVVHVYSGSQPLNSEVTDMIYLGYPGQDSFKYGCADMLALAQIALDTNSDHELKAKLLAAYPQAGDGTAAWATFADAMQDPNQKISALVDPNPLAGKFYRAIVTHTPDKKKPGKLNMNCQRMRAQAGA